MSVESSDVEYVKSIIFSDESSNGGRRGQVPLLSGVRHAGFFRGFRKANGLTGLIQV